MDHGCSSKTRSRRQSGKTTILKRVLKEISKGKSSTPNQQICCQSTIDTSHAAVTMRFMTHSAKRKSITHAAAARSNLHAAIPLRSADTALQNTKEPCTTAHKLLRFCSSKTGSRRQSGKTTLLKRALKEIFKGKSSMPNQQICCQSTIQTSHAAITMRFTTPSCKAQKYYACSCRKEQP